MTKTTWLTLPLLMALVTLPRISIDFYLPSLPEIGLVLHADERLLKATLTVFMLGYALSMLIAGPLADAIGRKRVLTAGLALYAVATVGCAISTSIEMLISARFLQALGGCCGTVIARIIVKDAYVKDTQIQILAQLSTAMAICPLIIPALGGLLALYSSWRMVFCCLSLLALAILLLSHQQLQELPRQNSLSFNALLKQYYLLLHNRQFLGYSCTIGLAWCNYFAFTMESPFIFQGILGFNSVKFGLAVAVVISGYLCGTQLTKKIANRLGWDKLIFRATLLALLSAVLLACLQYFFSPHWFNIAIPMILIMMSVGIIIPCTQAAVLQPFPTMTGTASGLFFFIQMVFGSICGFILQICQMNSITAMTTVILFSSLLLVIVFYQFILIVKQEGQPDASSILSNEA